MDKELLKTAAALCREAAEMLRQSDLPEKQAQELSEAMAAKGLISHEEKERFAAQISTQPEKLAQLKDSLAILPTRVGAIGEAIVKQAGNEATESDPWDRFCYNN